MIPARLQPIIDEAAPLAERFAAAGFTLYLVGGIVRDLLLDDVFSELDPDRSGALLAHLPPGQTVLTTAGGLPPGAEPDVVLEVERGIVRRQG